MIVCPALVVNVPARRFTMKIAHFALWTQQLDVQARFWVDFFAASINEKYLSQTNPGFASYFVTIDDEVVIELMTKRPAAGQRG